MKITLFICCLSSLGTKNDVFGLSVHPSVSTRSSVRAERLPCIVFRKHLGNGLKCRRLMCHDHLQNYLDFCRGLWMFLDLTSWNDANVWNKLSPSKWLEGITEIMIFILWSVCPYVGIIMPYFVILHTDLMEILVPDTCHGRWYSGVCHLNGLSVLGPQLGHKGRSCFFTVCQMLR